MHDSQTTLLLGLVVTLGATLHVGATAVRAGTPATRRYDSMAIALPAVTAVASLVAVLGLDATTVSVVGESAAIHPVRYVGWLVTVPLALVAVAAVGGGGSRITAAVALPGGGSVLLAAAGALTEAGIAGLPVRTTRLALWGVGAVLALVAIVVLLRPVSTRAGKQPAAVAIRVSILRNVAVLALVLYPVAWLVTDVLALLGGIAGGAFVLLADLVATVLFAVVLARDREVLAAVAEGSD